MLNEKELAVGASFEDDDQNWYVTGGYDDGFDYARIEVFNVAQNTFSQSIILPKPMYYHNVFPINSTHMVVLGGERTSDDVFIFDRYVL